MSAIKDLNTTLCMPVRPVRNRLSMNQMPDIYTKTSCAGSRHNMPPPPASWP